MALVLTCSLNFINNISIYENEKQFYFIGTHQGNKTFLIFTINKIRYPSSLDGNQYYYDLKDIIIEHKMEYDKSKYDELIAALGKESSSRLRVVEEDIKCIFGFFKFYLGYYVILVTEYSQIGKIGDNIINRVEKTKILPLFTVHLDNPCIDYENK